MEVVFNVKTLAPIDLHLQRISETTTFRQTTFQQTTFRQKTSWKTFRRRYLSFTDELIASIRRCQTWKDLCQRVKTFIKIFLSVSFLSQFALISKNSSTSEKYLMNNRRRKTLKYKIYLKDLKLKFVLFRLPRSIKLFFNNLVTSVRQSLKIQICIIF